MDRRHGIASVPEDINTCITQEGSNGERSAHPHQQLIENLHRKFFPREDKKPPPFFQNIFVLVANASIVATCEIDRVVDLLKGASDVARQDPQMRTGAHERGDSHVTSVQPANQQQSQNCLW